jgi:hypothetical protein
MRHLLLKPSSLWVTALVVVASLVVAASAAAARREISVAGESAFCNGQPVAAVDGVLQLGSGCVLNLQIFWLRGMRSAYLEFSSDGGSTYAKNPAVSPFPVVDVGLVSGVALVPCDALPSGTYLVRAHGFKSPMEHGDLFSNAFPDSISAACP